METSFAADFRLSLYPNFMDLFFATQHHAGLCAAWLERLASDKLKIQVVTSSGTVTDHERIRREVE